MPQKKSPAITARGTRPYLPRPTKRTAAIWIAVILLPLVCGAWVGMLISQRMLRARAESVLTNLQSIQVGTSTRDEAEAVISNWYAWGKVNTTCTGNGSECATYVRLVHHLPGMLARIVDHLGGRNAVVSAGFKFKGDTVTGKGFSEQVTLPVRGWYARRGAYAPTLVVSVDEDFDFTQAVQAQVRVGDPFRVVRIMPQSHEWKIDFTPQEAEAEKKKLMAFRFDCITQFSPCRDASEILPAVSELPRR